MTRNKPKTHYGPSPCGCGRYFAKTSNRRTPNPSDVTCGMCRRYIAQFGLRPRTDFPELPTFDVQAGKLYELPQVGCVVWFRCPVCGHRNAHGRPGAVLGGGDGHRVSHCDCWEHGYIIHEVSDLVGCQTAADIERDANHAEGTA